nr:reverse transcriptase domain-containing protein [Tanacetum cinerariifolium]
MKISEFMHGVTNPELIKHLHDKIPKSVDEMMRVTTTFLRGDVVASSRERKKSLSSWKQQEAGKEQNFKKGPEPTEVTISIQRNHKKTKSEENPGSSVHNSRNDKIPGPKAQQPVIDQATEEKIQVAIHPEYPEQTIAICSTLTKEWRKELCGLLRRKLDIFVWKPVDMTRVPRHIAEHMLNIHEGCLPVRQKEKGEALERNNTIYEEVEMLVDAGIMKEEDESPDTPMKDKKELPDLWILFTDGSSCVDERANKSLGEGIKARLDEKSKNCLEEISHVLWAHRTMIKSSNGETPFLLTYGTKAVIPVEIGMPTLRTAKVYMIKNDEALEINLDLLEKKEHAAIQEAKSKAKMEKYYNARVHNKSFKP